MLRPINVMRTGTLTDIKAGLFKPRGFVRFNGRETPGRVVGIENQHFVFQTYQRLHDGFLRGRGFSVGIGSPDFRLAPGFAITEDQPDLHRPGELVEVYHKETWRIAQVVDHANFLSYDVITLIGDRFWIGAKHVREPKPRGAYHWGHILRILGRLTASIKP